MKHSTRLAVLTSTIAVTVALIPRLVGAQCSTNTAFGTDALANATSTGCFNSAFGDGALEDTTTGDFNTAVGFAALNSNTTGFGNTAVGDTALLDSTGSFNTAVGQQALLSNTSGDSNTAIGNSALSNNTTADENTAVGYAALAGNTTGSNSAVGFEALLSNSTGTSNTALGYVALTSNTTSSANTAIGHGALLSNTSGTGNNTALGHYALLGSTGSSNIAIGSLSGFSLTTGSNNIDIGNTGVAAESNTIRIGTGGTQTATYIAGISGQTSSSGIAVYVNTSDKLGTATSSARFKEGIVDMGDRTSGLMRLRPVRFRYKQEIDPSGLEQFGLVAEEVAKVYPDLVTYDDKGEPQSVRYHFINAMLLNEVQEQARRITASEQQLKRQAQHIQALTTQVQLAHTQAERIQALTARLAHLEATVTGLRHAPALQLSQLP